MCGIFGMIAKKDSIFDEKSFHSILIELATLSETRGKESSGFCIVDRQKKRVNVLKAPMTASKLIQTSEFRNLFALNDRTKNISKEFAEVVYYGFGHSRLVTNGTQLNEENNQPVIKDNMVAVHNGIIVNDEMLWLENAELTRHCEIDTEVMLALLRYNLKNGKKLVESLDNTFNCISGTVSTAVFFLDLNYSLLYTNNGSLYILTDFKTYFIFASEKYIIDKLVSNLSLEKMIQNGKIIKVMPNTGYIINLSNLEYEFYELNNSDDNNHTILPLGTEIDVNVISIGDESSIKSSLVDLKSIRANKQYDYEKSLLQFNVTQISKLKRCKKCLLPETFPFISYDEKGVCVICNNYKLKNSTKPLENILNYVENYRSKNGEPDCLIPFSGGRDSSFVMHFVKKELNLNPIAFTYDWGMVTDLARRNIARVCGKLGVENIIISADIRNKRGNIKKNINAWLKKPELGMIPLFMAGDKYFFYYTNEVKKQNNIKLNIWGINNLENTDFKVGFCGIPLNFNKKRIYSISIKSQIKLFAFVFKNIITNPAYINSSILDTLGSFFVRYVSPKNDYIHLFDYVPWNENEIESILFKEYDWELAEDTNSTWRIGDGTASFYNYIYYTVAGFSEFDTFRSNQIREGMITRDDALAKIYEENMPRYESIKWYLDIIGIDFVTAINKINSIKKLYSV